MLIQPPIIIANWKLNGDKLLINNLLKKLIVFKNQNLINNTVIILPPLVYLLKCQEILENKKIYLGSQNVDVNISGAFTGETSISMLKDININYVLIGHSEIKQYHYENDDNITKKFKLVKEYGLIPILCMGETEQDKKSKKTKLICQDQIDKIMKLLGNSAFENSIIAYEPIWSIGTGNIPKLEEIDEIVVFIRNYIYQSIYPNKINNFFVIYGGSVNKDNVKDLLQKKIIDGVLVGSASISYENFSKIIKLSSEIIYK